MKTFFGLNHFAASLQWWNTEVWPEPAKLDWKEGKKETKERKKERKKERQKERSERLFQKFIIPPQSFDETSLSLSRNRNRNQNRNFKNGFRKELPTDQAPGRDRRAAEQAWQQAVQGREAEERLFGREGQEGGGTQVIISVFRVLVNLKKPFCFVYWQTC